MTIFYGKVNPALQLSSTSNYSDQLLSTAPIETFTATKVIDEPRRHQAAGDNIKYLLNTWTTIKRVEFANLAESLDTLYLSFATPDDPASTQYVTLEPGDSVMLANLYPASTLAGGLFAASLLVNGEALGAYYRLIVLGT